MKTMLGFLLLVVSAFSHLQTIYLNPSTLSEEQNCIKSGVYHYVITGIMDNEVPDKIFQMFVGIDEPVDANLSLVSGNVAHYIFSIPSGFSDNLDSAYTQISENWDGNFNLSCSPTAINVVEFKAKANQNMTFFFILSMVIGWPVLLVLFVCSRKGKSK